MRSQKYEYTIVKNNYTDLTYKGLMIDPEDFGPVILLLILTNKVKSEKSAYYLSTRY